MMKRNLSKEKKIARLNRIGERSRIQGEKITPPSAHNIAAEAELTEVLIKEENMQKLILLDQVDELNEEFDVMIIDTPAGVSKNVQYWTTSSASVIMVVTPEPTSLADCYATMKILSQTTNEKSFKLIVNMVNSEIEGKRIYEKISL